MGFYIEWFPLLSKGSLWFPSIVLSGGCGLKPMFSMFFFQTCLSYCSFCESWQARASGVDTNLTRRIERRHAEGPQIPQLQGNRCFNFSFFNIFFQKQLCPFRNTCILPETVVSFQKQSCPSRNSRVLLETVVSFQKQSRPSRNIVSF